MGVEHLPTVEGRFALPCCCSCSCSCSYAPHTIPPESTGIPYHFLLSYISHNNNNNNNNGNVDFFLTIISFTFMFPIISL